MHLSIDPTSPCRQRSTPTMRHVSSADWPSNGRWAFPTVASFCRLRSNKFCQGWCRLRRYPLEVCRSADVAPRLLHLCCDTMVLRSTPPGQTSACRLKNGIKKKLFMVLYFLNWFVLRAFGCDNRVPVLSQLRSLQSRGGKKSNWRIFFAM